MRKNEFHGLIKDQWTVVTGSEGNRSYAQGWYHALTSFLPHPAYRFVRTSYDSTCDYKETQVIEEMFAAGAPKPA